MKKRVQLLVDALRSGKFAQCRGALRNQDNKYCCLGVACEVYHQATKDGEWVPSSEKDADGTFVYSFLKATGILPRQVMEWFGFTQTNPRLKDSYDYLLAATILNDSDKLPFPEIADAFERTFITNGTK